MASKIVLISGCSSGIGLATAVFLAKDAEKRFKIYATMRNLTKKGQLEEEGKDCLGDTLIIKQMDVCSDASVEKAVKEVLDAEGRIDVLFNNAGICVSTPLEWFPTKTAKEIFDVNYFGAFRLIQAVLPGMKARKSGLIINNSSHFGIVGIPFVEVYCSSKFALEGLTESIAPILRQFNIRCCLLEPGPVQTLIFQKASDWTKENMDATVIDAKTKSLFETAQANLNRAFGDAMQGCEEVAQFVKDIILGVNKDLRCQTNEKFGPEDIPAKLADPTGNKSVDIITSRFLGGSNEKIP